MPFKDRLLTLTQVANTSAAVRPMLKGWRKVVVLSSGAEAHAIVLDGEQARVEGAPSTKPDITFELSEETLEALMAGTVTPLGAKLKGDIRSSGSIIDILRFASLLSAAVKVIKETGPGAQERAGAS